MQINIFVPISFLVLIIFTFIYLHARIIRPLTFKKSIKITLTTLLILFSASPIVAMIATRVLAPNSTLYPILSISYYLMSAVIIFALLVFIRDIFAFFIKIYTAIKHRKHNNDEQQNLTAEKQHLSRRQFLFNASSLAIVPLTTALTPIASHTAKNNRLLKKYDLHFPNLPSQLKGMKIAHLSDIHVGNTFTKADLQRVVDETNALNPDLIAITGDLVDGMPDILGPDLEPLRNLKPTIATCYCTGNHEYIWDGMGWSRLVQSLGIIVLNNANVTLNYNNTPFTVAGAIDYRGDRRNKIKSSPAKALANIPPEHFKIMLVHQPASVDESVENGANLVLLGHTHGGQFFPISLINGYIHKYARGLYDINGAKVMVSCGTGYWGPPNRIAVPPEIILITLT